MAGLRPLFRWRRPTEAPSPELLAAGRERGLGARLLALLARRGHRSPADLAALFDPPEPGLHDPALLPDAAAVVTRVRRARAQAEGVLVVGDFDADGLSGLAVLVLALRYLGLDVEAYVPSRQDDGHGLSLRAVERARSAGRTLIVTVDCGTTSQTEIAEAAGYGIDVIVTDHHTVAGRLPEALAVVNPRRTDAQYPDARLTGSGVAFKVAQLPLAETTGRREYALGLADLATIGTVADVAPVLGENRSLARLGLAILRRAPRPGLAALLASAGVSGERVDLEDLAFKVAPRLNAVGRLGEAIPAARLLLAESDTEAKALARELEEANLDRRELTERTIAEAREALAGDGRAAVLLRGDWPVGIIGLVAGRLAEDLRRPAVVFSTGLHPWRASARSPEGFDLAAALGACADLLERFGGHPAAAGCTLLPEAYDAFAERFIALAVAAPRDPVPVLDLDLVLPAGAVDYALLRELEPLEPVGAGNPAPLIGVAGLVVARARTVGGGHTQMTLRKGREILDGVAFGRGELAGAVAEGQAVDVVASLASRSFAGIESLQLEIRDVAPAGHLDDLRAPVTPAGAAA